MSPEKWQQIKGQVQDAFSDVEIKTEKLPEPPAGNASRSDAGRQFGDMEIILFTGPLGRMKLEYITKPILLDKKTHGSRRIGSETAVEYIYSDCEFSHQLRAYKWDEAQNDWLEINMKDSFQLS